MNRLAWLFLLLGLIACRPAPVVAPTATAVSTPTPIANACDQFERLAGEGETAVPPPMK